MSTEKISPVKRPKPTPVASIAVLKSPAVSPAFLRRRHVGLILSFLAFVIFPTAIALFYLFQIANDQYSSRVSFSIRSEELQNPLDALSSLGQLSTGSSSDASILNEYLRSQKLVEDIGENLDLNELYSRPEFDPFFAFDPEKPIEDLVTYFQTMNYVTFDAGNGLLDIESFAFSSDDAQTIATAIMDASQKLVEHLSIIAQDDAIRNATLELELARDRLEDTREALNTLREQEQIINPLADLEGHMGVLTALQSQMATALIAHDLLIATTQENDPRFTSSKRTLAALEHRLKEERKKLSQMTVHNGRSFASIIGDFEGLMSDREFAEKAYLSANVTFETAMAEARRKSKYLAAHIPPTLAQSSQYPNRPLWALSVFGACLLIWSVAMLTVYAMLDRR